MFLLLIVLLLVESFLLVLAAAGAKPRRWCIAAPIEEEAAEALEAVGAGKKDGA